LKTRTPSPPPEPLLRLTSELAEILQPAERSYFGQPMTPRHPVIYVIGNSRSGSTLMMQWLASTGLVCYPSNLMSRFYASPYIGARIQQLLTAPEFQFRNELKGCMPGFQSSNGKTSGALEPHEFWYFWRRFIPRYFLEWMPPEAEARVDEAGLRDGLAAIQRAFDKPLALKGKFFNYNPRKLYAVFERCIFVHVHRDPILNCQSLLLARRQRYNDDETWFGVRPREYQSLLGRDAYAQIAGQVFFTDRSIREQLRTLDPCHVMDVRYEDFCGAPSGYYDTLVEKLAAMNHVTDRPYEGPIRFEPSSGIRITEEELHRLKTAYLLFSEG
jgi:hypothetical protein